VNERDRSCNQVGGSRILSGLDCKLSNHRSAEIPELGRSCAALHCRRGVRLDQTAATGANLIRSRLPEYPKVLDVGCAGGTLAGELPPSVHYLGIDASENAIEAAQSLWVGDDIPAKGVGAFLSDQRESQASRLSRRRARITALVDRITRFEPSASRRTP
jgi:SAM-dependent methyltransferase